MSDKELDKLAQEMSEYAKKANTKADALQFLVRAGICQADGKLQKVYQS